MHPHLHGRNAGARSGRFQEGIDHYTELVQSAADLCRQTAYIKTEDGNYNHPVPGVEPTKGQSTCEDPDKQAIVRHCVAFLAATRQDIRTMRLGKMAELGVQDLHIHCTPEELVCARSPAVQLFQS